MTTAEQKQLQKDLSNPVHLFTLIVENNPSAVSNAFQTWGYNYSDSTNDQMVSELVRMYQAGGTTAEKALKLASVPYQFNVFPAGFDQAITGQQAPPQMRTTDGTGGDEAWYSNINWGDIIEIIFAGVITVTGRGGGNGSGSGSGAGNGGGTPPPPPPPSGISTQYIVIGVAGILIIGALFFAMKKG
jgi:hypothetical protein